METMEKISDIKTPELETVTLLKGKVAKIGPVTLDVLCWIEEKYESWENFGKMLRGGKISLITDFLFRLLDNQEDFKDVNEFKRSFPIDKMESITKLINKVTTKSMPSQPEQAAVSEGTEGKK
jgi:hypothetical protein